MALWNVGNVVWLISLRAVGFQTRESESKGSTHHQYLCVAQRGSVCTIPREVYSFSRSCLSVFKVVNETGARRASYCQKECLLVMTKRTTNVVSCYPRVCMAFA